MCEKKLTTISWCEKVYFDKNLSSVARPTFWNRRTDQTLWESVFSWGEYLWESVVNWRGGDSVLLNRDYKWRDITWLWEARAESTRGKHTLSFFTLDEVFNREGEYCREYLFILFVRVKCLISIIASSQEKLSSLQVSEFRCSFSQLSNFCISIVRCKRPNCDREKWVIQFCSSPGSSNGIGRGTAIFFAKAGAKVTITGRNAATLAVFPQSLWKQIWSPFR